MRRATGSIQKSCTFESIHISAYVIYAVAIQETLDLFIEFASGLVRAEGHSITLKLGIQRRRQAKDPRRSSAAQREHRRGGASLWHRSARCTSVEAGDGSCTSAGICHRANHRCGCTSWPRPHQNRPPLGLCPGLSGGAVRIRKRLESEGKTRLRVFVSQPYIAIL